MNFSSTSRHTVGKRVAEVETILQEYVVGI